MCLIVEVRFSLRSTARSTNENTGGRTAWSTIAVVNNVQYPARFWYDGAFMEQAREDAAEIALRKLTGCIDQNSQPPPASQYGRALAA